MTIPSKKECFKLLDKYEVRDIIRQHSVAVNKVAMYLGRMLKAEDEDIDLKSLDRASLLHDIAKHLADDEDHPKAGYNILRKEGYENIAAIAVKHTARPEELESMEEKLLWYADRRVLNDKIVSLEERFSYLKDRYSTFIEEIEKSEPFAYQLEGEIFEKIGRSPKDLKDLIDG